MFFFWVTSCSASFSCTTSGCHDGIGPAGPMPPTSNAHSTHVGGGAGYYPTPRHGACYECNGRPPRYTVKVTALATAKKFRAKELRRGAKERKNARREAEFVAAANEKRAAFDAGVDDRR